MIRNDEKDKKIKFVCGLIIGITLLVFLIVYICCVVYENRLKTVYYKETAKYSNGVEITATDYVQKQSIKVNDWVTYDTNNMFICIEFTITNKGGETYNANSDNIYLKYGEKRITQHARLSYEFGNTFRSVSVGATLTKIYWAIFEVDKNIPVEDLKVVISCKQSLFVNEKYAFKLISRDA